MDKEPTDRSAGDLHGRAERLGLPAHCEHFLAEWVGNDAGVALDAALQCDIDHPGKEHVAQDAAAFGSVPLRSEEHTSELQSLMRIAYDVFCLKKKKKIS